MSNAFDKIDPSKISLFLNASRVVDSPQSPLLQQRKLTEPKNEDIYCFDPPFATREVAAALNRLAPSDSELTPLD